MNLDPNKYSCVRLSLSKCKSQVLHYLLPVYLILGLGLINTCGDPGDLEAVSGIQGEIQISGTMPDSIKAVALVVLMPEAINDQDNLGDYLINYSDPLFSTGAYYTQLKPGQYMGVIVGLLVDPGIFAANIDSYLDGSDLPLVQLSEGAHAFLIRENEMQELDWVVDF